MIPAGLDRRVNTFLSQARNSLVKDRALEMVGRERIERKKRENGCSRVWFFKKKKFFNQIIPSPCLFLPCKLFTQGSHIQLVQMQTHTQKHTVQSRHSRKLGQWQHYTGVTSKVPIVSITLVQLWHLFSI